MQVSVFYTAVMRPDVDELWKPCTSQRLYMLVPNDVYVRCITPGRSPFLLCSTIPRRGMPCTTSHAMRPAIISAGALAVSPAELQLALSSRRIEIVDLSRHVMGYADQIRVQPYKTEDAGCELEVIYLEQGLSL